MHSKMDPSLKLKICVGKIIHLARNNTVQLVCIDNINSLQLRLLEKCSLTSTCIITRLALTFSHTNA